MTPQLGRLLILLGGIAFVLILIILFFSSNSRFRLFINSFLEDKDDENSGFRDSFRSAVKNLKRDKQPAGRRQSPSPERIERMAERAERAAERSERTAVQQNTVRPQRITYNDYDTRKAPESMVEMATLIQKSDDRMRVIESTGQTHLIDEYYELLFVTRKGKKIKIECSREAYDKIPFNQQGSLTYRKNVLVKFKYYEDIVYNN